MAFKDYYKIMGISQQATPDEIQHSFRKLARQFHPDVSTEPNATDRFKEIREAYEVLKNPQKREAYDNSIRIIKPYSLAWFLNKKEHWHRTRAQTKATDSARHRANVSHESTSYSLIFLTIILSVIVVASGIYFFQSKDIKNEIYPESEKISSDDTEKSLLAFFISHPEIDMIERLMAFNKRSKDNVFEHPEIKRALIEYYNNEIDKALEVEDFKKAKQSFTIIKNQYPNTPSLSNKYGTIKDKQDEKLLALNQQYNDCLKHIQVLEFEALPCAGDAWQAIQVLNPKANIVNTTLLNAIYEKAIEHTLLLEDYTQTEALILDWKKSLPQAIPQRHTLSNTLANKQIVSDLTNTDTVALTETLHRLSKFEEETRLKILSDYKVRQNLLNYYGNNLTALNKARQVDNSKMPDLVETSDNIAIEMTELEEAGVIVSEENSDNITEEVSTASDAVSAESDEEIELSPEDKLKKVSTLLNTCPNYYENYHLTGSENSVLSCYREVLSIDPNNSEAQQGLEKLENYFIPRIERALSSQLPKKVAQNIRRLERINPRANQLGQFKRDLSRLKKELERQSSVEVMDNFSLEPEDGPITKKKVPAPITPISALEPEEETIAEPIEEETNTGSCAGCDCDKLLYLISRGISPLTEEQRQFYKTSCR